MAERPRLKLKLNWFDYIIEGIAVAMLLAMWVYIIDNYQLLPHTIPTHYNIEGVADGFGNKSNLFSLPIVATVLALGLTVLNRFPHIFNYPTAITSENAQRQYTFATRLIRILKLVIILIFGGIALQTISNSLTKNENLTWWTIPGILLVFFVVLIGYLIKATKQR